MKKMLVAAAVMFAVIAGPGAALAQPHHGDPIRVQRCEPQRGGVAFAPGFTPVYYPARPFFFDPYGRRYYERPVSTRAPSLSIDYRNVSSKTVKAIEFGLVARGELVAEVRDVGTFTTDAEIKHVFGLDPNVFPLQTAFSQCIPLRVEYEDGQVWKRAHLPPSGRILYQR
ncbi:MAG: hypothetical protein ACREM2_02100 [Vulcanimicrobiaceae bacterium]